MSPRSQWRLPMGTRDTHEPHRVATPLELLFDLCFVVAIALTAQLLHHAVAEGDVLHGIVAYLTVFFSVWWAWMNFTWFASAYDTDDVAYRLTTLVQIAGVLVLAAGVPDAFHGHFGTVTVGYVIMRSALVTQWLRASAGASEGRRTARRMALGVSLCMIGWGLILLAHGTPHLVLFLVMVAAELAVPLWAERTRPTPWHPHHISERYGLLFIIVLGEIVLSTTVAVQAGFVQDRLWWVAASGLVIVFAFWWLYFDHPAHEILVDDRHAFVWGYGHYVVFGAAAAIGAGIAAVVERPDLSGAPVTIPVAILLLALWALHIRPRTWLEPAAAVLVLAGTFAGPSLVVTAVILAVLVAARLLSARVRRP
ncbi:low temperature requirement protein A [Dactylosporangium sp. NPDC005555]|uniref:low temperature requirement protein A n=1 Tax=Dactylosporangium sp. NPDC005555 TaxID=3154889 RepID=UPI0033B0965E